MNARADGEGDSHFRTLVQATPAPCLVLSAELVIMDVSDAWLSQSGMERSQVVGRAVFEIFPDAARAALPTLAHGEALARLTDALRDIDTPAEIIFRAAEILGKALGISRVGYGTIDQQAETLTVERDWNAAGVATLAGTLHLRDFGSFIDDLKLGNFIAIDDVRSDPRTAPAPALCARAAPAPSSMRRSSNWGSWWRSFSSTMPRRANGKPTSWR